MVNHLKIAIPDSSLVGLYNIKEKTEKVGIIARTLAIFQVSEIIIYHDSSLNPKKAEFESRLLKHVLSYIETPQYLRKILFPHHRNLQYVGLLSPLATPHHPTEAPLRNNQFREGVVYLSENERAVVEVGFKNPLDIINPPQKSLKNRNIRVTTQIHKNEKGGYVAEIIPRDKVISKVYWGYKVKTTPQPLIKFGQRIKNENNLVIATSKKGMTYNNFNTEMISKNKPVLNKDLIFIFGSPHRGLSGMLKDTGGKLNDISNYCVNSIPNPGTRTVRLEEALPITLARILPIFGIY
ncbi:MAG: putative RNA uridine N3 methyltransferase [Candidatus Hodarchaeales archaeon]|jgi:predicted SPOUT superfamily RNA methylase MTH1